MNFNQLINEIRKLNPGVEIRIGDPEFDSRAYDRIFSSIPMDKLKLPQGYYSNEKNGITNKHNTATGNYISLSVESLNNMRSEQTYPNVDVSESLETTNVKKIAIALQKLNPGVVIKLANPDLDSEAYSKIYCNVPMSELALPSPFYSNEKNGITNKHTSHSGMYAAIKVQNINEVDPIMLMSTGYDLEIAKREQYNLDNEQNLQSTREESQIKNENRKFYIMQREKAINDVQKEKNKLAILSGICILNTIISVYFSGADINQVLQHELNTMHSWEALGQYFKDLGALTTLFAVSSCTFIAKYFQKSKKLKQIQRELIDCNSFIGNSKIDKIGIRKNVMSR